MSLEKHIFKTQESFLLKTDKDLDSVKLNLVEAGVQLVVEPSKTNNQTVEQEEDKKTDSQVNQKIIAGKLKENSFEIQEPTNFFLKAFTPKLIGKIEEIENGTQISLVSQPSWLMSILLQKIGAAFIGALLALITSTYLLPNTISITYAFTLTIVLPLIVFLVTIVCARLTVPKSVDRVLSSLKTKFKAEEDKDNEHNFLEYIQQPPVSQNFIAGALSAILFLAIAFGLHNLAAYYWENGNYKMSAQLCRPVASIASAFLPNDSAAVADTKYYLAECLRCQGKLEEAKRLYLHVGKLYKQDIGEKHAFVADVNFALGRIAEKQGQFESARKHYLEALELWSNNERTKQGYIIFAKVKDRLAVVALKQKKADKAILLLEEAYKLDRKYRKRSYGKSAMAEDLNDLAVAEFYSGNLEKAKHDLVKSMKIKSKLKGNQEDSLVAGYINLAFVNAKLGLENEARDNLSQAIKILNLDLSAKTIVKQIVSGKITSAYELPIQLTEGYKKLVQKHNSKYEFPKFGSRANILLNLDGRL